MNRAEEIKIVQLELNTYSKETITKIDKNRLEHIADLTLLGINWEDWIVYDKITNNEKKKKDKINSVKNSIGQIEKNIDIVEEWLNPEDFQDFCDNAYTCISYLRTIIKKVKSGDYEC